MIHHLVVKIIKLIISNRPSVVCTHIGIHACMFLKKNSQNDNFPQSIFNLSKKSMNFFRPIKKHAIFQHEKSGDAGVVWFLPNIDNACVLDFARGPSPAQT